MEESSLAPMYDQKKCSSAAVAEFEEDYTVEAAAPSLEKNTLSIRGSSRAMQVSGARRQGESEGVLEN